jgi:hypothetical protein
MTAARLPHPFLPVPLAERQRLSAGVLLALDDLADDPARGWLELFSAAVITDALLDSYEAADGRRAVQRALAALRGARQGRGTVESVRAACGPLVDTFEALIRVTTWRRLLAAQDAAKRAIETELVEAVESNRPTTTHCPRVQTR